MEIPKFIYFIQIETHTIHLICPGDSSSTPPGLSSKHSIYVLALASIVGLNLPRLLITIVHNVNGAVEIKPSIVGTENQ